MGAAIIRVENYTLLKYNILCIHLNLPNYNILMECIQGDFFAKRHTIGNTRNS